MASPDPRSDPNAFPVRLDPPGLAWQAADAGRRSAYYREVGRLAVEAKDLELARGLDRFGRRMTPIAASTRERRKLWDYSPMGRADPDAPPLTPCRAASRTRSLLRFAAYPDGAWVYWGYDPHTGRPWGEVLDFHRRGGGPSRLPVRDVIGLSDKSIARVRRDAWAWWHAGAHARTIAAATNARPAVVAPSGVVMPRPAVTPFDTGWRRLKGGKFESASKVGVVTPIVMGRP